jgi:hypothetical protein
MTTTVLHGERPGRDPAPVVTAVDVVRRYGEGDTPAEALSKEA